MSKNYIYWKTLFFHISGTAILIVMLLAPKDFFVGRGGGGADEMVNAFRMIKGQGHVFAIKVSALKCPQILRKILIFPYLIDMDFSVFDCLLWFFILIYYHDYSALKWLHFFIMLLNIGLLMSWLI